MAAVQFLEAVQYGNMNGVRHYVESGGDVNVRPAIYDGRTALYLAAYDDRREILRYLLEHGADPTLYPSGGIFNGDSVLLQMIMHHNNDLESIKTILERGADPNRMIQTFSRDTPVSRTNNPDVLKLLLEHGGNPNVQNPNMPPKADILAQNIHAYSQHAGPLSQWMKDDLNNQIKMLEVLCEAGSTSQSCEAYRAKKNVLKTLPENIMKNILKSSFGGGGKRRKSTRRRSKNKRSKKTRSKHNLKK
jgi:ankyrin repeat protein